MKKISLIFPPFLPGAANHPYLSVPLLATILESAGHEVFRFDFNYRLNKDLLDPELYEEIAEKSQEEELKNIYRKGADYIRNLKESDYVENWVWGKIQYDLSLKVIDFPNSLETYFKDGLEMHPKIVSYINSYVDEVLAKGSDTVAFSIAFGEQLLYGLEMIKLIKERSPKTVIFLGGAQISLLDSKQIKTLVDHSKVDLIFQGYAEGDIVSIVEKFGLSEKPIAIMGGTSSRESMKGMEHVKFEFDKSYNHNRRYPVLVTKGCYWGKCEFCDYVLMGDLGKDRYIARPVEEVYEELKAIRKIDPESNFILISDAVPPKWYLKLAKLANADGFPLRTYSYMINNKALNEEFFQEISKACVRHFTFGTESTSDRVLRLMNKQATQKIIIDNLKLAKKYGVDVQINLIPNYPTTTYKEALGAYKILNLFQDTLSGISVFKFYLSANTSMFKNPSEFSLEIQEAPYVKSEHNGFHTAEFKVTEGMTQEEEDDIYAKLTKLDSVISKKWQRRKQIK